MSNMIKEQLEQTTKFSNIHALAEKIHISELCLLDICKNMDNIDDFIEELQKYSSKISPSLYDTMLLFLYFSKTFIFYFCFFFVMVNFIPRLGSCNVLVIGTPIIRLKILCKTNKTTFKTLCRFAYYQLYFTHKICLSTY